MVLGGLFALGMTAAIVVQTIVAWLTVFMIGIFVAVQAVKHVSSESSYTFKGDRKFATTLVVEISAIGLGFLVLSNFLFSAV